jgi:hypothetical protein
LGRAAPGVWICFASSEKAYRFTLLAYDSLLHQNQGKVTKILMKRINSGIAGRRNPLAITPRP